MDTYTPPLFFFGWYLYIRRCCGGGCMLWWCCGAGYTVFFYRSPNPPVVPIYTTSPLTFPNVFFRRRFWTTFSIFIERGVQFGTTNYTIFFKDSGIEGVSLPEGETPNKQTLAQTKTLSETQFLMQIIMLERLQISRILLVWLTH